MGNQCVWTHVWGGSPPVELLQPSAAKEGRKVAEVTTGKKRQGNIIESQQLIRPATEGRHIATESLHTYSTAPPRGQESSLLNGGHR